MLLSVLNVLYAPESDAPELIDIAKLAVESLENVFWILAVPGPYVDDVDAPKDNKVVA